MKRKKVCSPQHHVLLFIQISSLHMDMELFRVSVEIYGSTVLIFDQGTLN